MSDSIAARFAAAAAALAGVPFRLHGRDREHGVDCVGLVALALRECRREPLAPAGYTLRALDPTPLFRFAAANGFAAAAGDVRPGDLLLLRPSPAQAHLAVALDDGAHVHAHAGLGRVVVEHAPLTVPCPRRWRLIAKD